MRTAVALGLGLGALVVGGGIAYAAAGASKPASPPATAASFNVSTAIPVTPGSSITIPIGSGLAVQNTGGTQVTTTNAAVVAPSQPATANGFVAITTGTATLQIPPNSNNPAGATIAVTVVTSTGGAIGSSNPGPAASSVGTSSSSSSSAGASLPAAVVPVGLPAGSPQGLVSSGPTSQGWAQHITITPNVAGILYQGFYGDVVTISLPAGAHWRATSASMGPASGIDDFVFTLIEDIVVVLSYTDASGANQGTTLAFELGGVFEPTTQIATGDYVILALAQGDYQATVNTLMSAIAQNVAGTVEGQQGQTLQAAQTSLGATPTEEQLLSWIFMLGPWASTWAIDPHSVALFLPGATLPSWWPSADSGAASEFHVLARYIGAGAAVSALPFPVTAYKRVA